MKRFLKYLRALRLYFVMRQTKYWYRDSTKEWVRMYCNGYNSQGERIYLAGWTEVEPVYEVL